MTSITRDAGELAHPGQLAPRVVARAALHRLDVAARAAPRSRAPCAPSRDARPRARGAPPRARPRRASRSTRASICAYSAVALHRQPGQQRRVAQLVAPQLRRRPRGGSSSPSVEQLERPHDAPPVVSGRCPRAAQARARRQHGVQRRRAVLLQLGRPALARALGRWRAQVELGQRRAQVQAGAARPRSGAARRRAASSISACASSRVLADAEGRVERQERDQAVLERRRARAAEATPVSVSRPA